MQQKYKVNRTLAATLVIAFIFAPATVVIGSFIIKNKHYYFISMLLIVYTLAVFFLSFENKKPKARELVVIAVLSALSVASRAAFFMIPQFKPMAAVIIITGACFGAQAGFLTGALSAFVSNFFFGQGAWTPWQMLGFGLIGLLAGLLFYNRNITNKRISVCIYGGLSVFLLYGGIMNLQTTLFYTEKFTLSGAVTVWITSLPFDFTHAVATVIFLFLFAKPLSLKLIRIKQKYGIMGKI